jgi:hypothetical protein
MSNSGDDDDGNDDSKDLPNAGKRHQKRRKVDRVTNIVPNNSSLAGGYFRKSVTRTGLRWIRTYRCRV